VYDSPGDYLASGIDGLVATNTTLSRVGLPSNEVGGASGAILSTRSLALVRRIVRLSDGLPGIAAGGVMGVDDAQRRLDAGAALVQVYSGLVFEGPGLVRRIAAGLRAG